MQSFSINLILILDKRVIVVRRIGTVENLILVQIIFKRSESNGFLYFALLIAAHGLLRREKFQLWLGLPQIEMHLEGLSPLEDERIAILEACNLFSVDILFAQQFFTDFEVLWHGLTHEHIDFCAADDIFVDAGRSLGEECGGEPIVPPDFVELFEGSQQGLHVLAIGVGLVLRKELLCLIKHNQGWKLFAWLLVTGPGKHAFDHSDDHLCGIVVIRIGPKLNYQLATILTKVIADLLGIARIDFPILVGIVSGIFPGRIPTNAAIGEYIRQGVKIQQVVKNDRGQEQLTNLFNKQGCEVTLPASALAQTQ